MNIASADSDLVHHMAADLSGERPEGLNPLLDALRQHFGSALQAVVLYGSTRRNDNPLDGLVDLMAIVDDYRKVHSSWFRAMLNHRLPPNVYYLEADYAPEDGSPKENRDSATLRSKYIVISAKDLYSKTRGGLDGYFWARFTQPCRLVYARNHHAAEHLAICRANAAAHFAREAAALDIAQEPPKTFWENALRASYGCELRPEPPDAAASLIARDPQFWESLGLLLPALPKPSRIGRLRWRLRRVWSRTLNVLRLFKAAGTFANGVDYLSWKLERHSGVRVEPTDRMRRHPRLAAWGLLFRLIRSGALR